MMICKQYCDNGSRSCLFQDIEKDRLDTNRLGDVRVTVDGELATLDDVKHDTIQKASYELHGTLERTPFSASPDEEYDDIPCIYGSDEEYLTNDGLDREHTEEVTVGGVRCYRSRRVSTLIMSVTVNTSGGMDGLDVKFNVQRGVSK